MDKPIAPYRSMPLGYQATWLLIMAIVIIGAELRRFGWPLRSSPEYVSENLLAIVIGAYFWGWVFWKFWLYRRFPKK
jgi:hypothetical protein